MEWQSPFAVMETGLNPMLLAIIIGVIAYFFGSISTSVIMSKLLKHMDIREHGSGNAGTTNTLRVLGAKAAVVVLAGDVIKGIAATLIGKILLGDTGAYVGAIMCIVGHMYPVFFGFRGGKGVATIIGAIFIVDWRLLLIVLGVFFLTFAIKKTVSVSSICCVTVAPFATWFLSEHSLINTGLMLLLSCIIIVNHRSNIKRIIKGEEPKTSFKKEK